MDLLAATDHQDAYTWAAVLLAHFAIGAGLFMALNAWFKNAADSAITVFSVYFMGWEGMAQAFEAGLADALVDTAGVLAGAVFVAMVWDHLPRRAGIAAALLAALALVGIGERTK